MKNHDPRIAVTEDSLHRGVRSKSRETVRVMELKPTSPWRHARSMPDSRDPATPPAPAPTEAGSPFGPSDSPTRFREDPFFLGAALAAAAGFTSMAVAVIQYSIVTFAPTLSSPVTLVLAFRAISQRSVPFCTAIMSLVTSSTGRVNW